MLRPVFFLLMTFSLSIPAKSQNRDAFEKRVYTGEAGSLPYRFLQPENADPEKKFPLVIFLHGAGERGNDNEAQIRHITRLFLNPTHRLRFPCFVIAPQCPEGLMWAAHDRQGPRLLMRDQPEVPMALLIELLAETERMFPIDPDRIYVTGLSMGGFGTWDLIARFPDRFAAAVPVCGGGDPGTAPLIRDLPVWAFHGALDRVVPPSNSRVMVRALQEAGARPGYSEYPDVGHNSWTKAYEDPYLLPWLFEQHRQKRSAAD